MRLWPNRGNEVAVILSEAKDLQFRSGANQCRFFASLRMTGPEGAGSCHLSSRKPPLY